MVNPEDARQIVKALKPLEIDKQIEIVAWLTEGLGKPYTGVMWPLVDKAISQLFRNTSMSPWEEGDETLEEVLEALETGNVGTCDNCDRYNVIRHGAAAEAEGVECKWGCR